MVQTWGSRDLGFEDILSRGAWCTLHFHELTASRTGGWEKVDSTNRGAIKETYEVLTPKSPVKQRRGERQIG
jgi:hypothetical protein